MASHASRLRVLVAVLSCVLALAATSTAFADPRDFTLENDSLSYVLHVYVSPSSSNNWGDDVLDVDILPPGQSVDIVFDPTSGRTCIYDILIVTQDGSRTRKNRENLCLVSTLTYSED